MDIEKTSLWYWGNLGNVQVHGRSSSTSYHGDDVDLCGSDLMIWWPGDLMTWWSDLIFLDQHLEVDLVAVHSKAFDRLQVGRVICLPRYFVICLPRYVICLPRYAICLPRYAIISHCDMPAKIKMWYACNHIFSHLCDCDMLAGERSVVGSLGLVLGSLWGSAILVWELRSVRSRAMSTTRERPSDGTAELSQEVEILPWWCGKRNWPAVVWRSALRWGRGGRCCRGSPRRRSLATKLPRDWSPPAWPASDY